MGEDDTTRSSMVKNFMVGGSVGSVEVRVTVMVVPATVNHPGLAFLRVMHYRIQSLQRTMKILKFQ